MTSGISDINCRAMRRTLLAPYLVALLALCVAIPPTVLAEDTDQMIRDAIAHHDQQEFDLAVNLFTRILELEPHNGMAVYELAYTHQVSGDLRSCIKVVSHSLDRLQVDVTQSHLMPGLYMLLASCHSSAGETGQALKVFGKALQQYPNDYGLNFNIAITLSNNERYEEAIEHLDRAIRVDPLHPSPYYMIGVTYQRQGQSIPAVLSLLTFLQREYNTARCVNAAQSIFNIAFSSVGTNESSDETTIYIDPESNSDSPDVMALSLALSVATLAHAPDGKVKESNAESRANILQSFISIAAQLDPESNEDSVLSTYLFPSVRRIEEASVTEAFAYFVVNTAGVSGADKWIDSHPEDVDALVDYFNLLAEERSDDQ